MWGSSFQSTAIIITTITVLQVALFAVVPFLIEKYFKDAPTNTNTPYTTVPAPQDQYTNAPQQFPGPRTTAPPQHYATPPQRCPGAVMPPQQN